MRVSSKVMALAIASRSAARLAAILPPASEIAHAPEAPACQPSDQLFCARLPEPCPFAVKVGNRAAVASSANAAAERRFASAVRMSVLCCAAACSSAVNSGLFQACHQVLSPNSVGGCSSGSVAVHSAGSSLACSCRNSVLLAHPASKAQSAAVKVRCVRFINPKPKNLNPRSVPFGFLNSNLKRVFTKKRETFVKLRKFRLQYNAESAQTVQLVQLS